MDISQSNWNSEKISHHYNKLNYIGKRLYIRRFETFWTTKKIIEVILKKKGSFLDVGIGQANFYRYLNYKKINVNYTGADISSFFVEKSKSMYPNVKFNLTDESLNDNLDSEYDFVYSRGVSIHQSSPFKFLENLINKSIKCCVFDIHTRDLGETIYDVDKSCQYIAGTWIPHIVVNFDELIKFLKKFEKIKNSRIEINKFYKILGGQKSRFLPKEMYDSKTGCAQTSVFIDLETDKEEFIFSNKQEILKKNFWYYKDIVFDLLNK